MFGACWLKFFIYGCSLSLLIELTADYLDSMICESTWALSQWIYLTTSTYFYTFSGQFLATYFLQYIFWILNKFLKLLKIIFQCSQNFDLFYLFMGDRSKLRNKAPDWRIPNHVYYRPIKSILCSKISPKITLNSFHSKKRSIPFPKKSKFYHTQ